MSELFTGDKKSVTFPTDYDSIIERILRIDPIQYGKTRNYTEGAVTYLSPYVSRGVISGKQIHDAVIANGYSAAESEKLIQELAWREYFQRVWQNKGDSLFEDIKQPQSNVLHHRMIASVIQGATGIHAIDQHIKDFYHTGYLHNHVRMYVASITCNMGKAHWSLPSRWMYAHLLDGDLASNTCSWQWVAGAFSSKKYYCNQENINRFTTSQQQNTFLDLPAEALPHVPIPASLTEHTDWRLETILPSLPKPLINTSRPTLLYNSYNLDPRWREGENVNRILLLEPSHFQKFPVSQTVLEFILALSENIPGIQVMIGEVAELVALYKNASHPGYGLISKEHPAFTHYPGSKDERDWMYPTVTGYHPSFFAFWKQCQRSRAKATPSPIAPENEQQTFNNINFRKSDY
jgi:deoxyribodipyrimidine photo-lyase